MQFLSERELFSGALFFKLKLSINVEKLSTLHQSGVLSNPLLAFYKVGLAEEKHAQV